MVTVRLSRTLKVSASHRLNSPHLTAKENAEIFGKCNRVNGHGHNYTIRLTVEGKIDHKTGMVMNIATLKAIAQERIEDIIDHRNLDLDVPYFAKRPSTTENLAVFIWKEMEEGLRSENALTKSLRLFEVEIYETDANSVVYRGESDSSDDDDIPMTRQQYAAER